MRTGIVIVLILVAGFVGLFLYWGKISGMVSKDLTEKMGVPVNVGAIFLTPSSIKVNGITIGNVKDGKLPKAFSAEKIAVNAPLTRYLSKEIVIDQIDVNDIYLGLEFDSIKGTKGNWTTIMGNLDANTPKSKKGETPKRVIFIKRIVFNNVQADVYYRQEGGKVIHLKPIKQIVLTNISTAGDFPVDQLTNSVLGQMLKQVFVQQNLQNMVKDLFQNQDTLNQYVEPFKGLFK